jgi:hypothetical protein
MKTKLLVTCILLIFCTCIKSSNVGKLYEYDKEISLYANRSTFLYGTKATRIIGELKKKTKRLLLHAQVQNGWQKQAMVLCSTIPLKALARTVQGFHIMKP